MKNTQIKTTGVIWLVVLVLGFFGFVYAKGYVAKKSAERAQWNDCLKRYFGGKHDLQKMPVVSRGVERSPYLVMADGRATFSFEIDGSFYVHTIPSNRVKMALDMKTKEPWIEFQYNDYMHYYVGCNNIDKMLMMNVDYVTVHMAAQDFQLNAKD